MGKSDHANALDNAQSGKKPLSSRLEPFPWTCMRLLSIEESDWILLKMKMMKEKKDVHLELVSEADQLSEYDD